MHRRNYLKFQVDYLVFVFVFIVGLDEETENISLFLIKMALIPYYDNILSRLFNQNNNISAPANGKVDKLGYKFYLVTWKSSLSLQLPTELCD